MPVPQFPPEAAPLGPERCGGGDAGFGSVLALCCQDRGSPWVIGVGNASPEVFWCIGGRGGGAGAADGCSGVDGAVCAPDCLQGSLHPEPSAPHHLTTKNNGKTTGNFYISA